MIDLTKRHRTADLIAAVREQEIINIANEELARYRQERETRTGSRIIAFTFAAVIAVASVINHYL